MLERHCASVFLHRFKEGVEEDRSSCSTCLVLPQAKTGLTYCGDGQVFDLNTTRADALRELRELHDADWFFPEGGQSTRAIITTFALYSPHADMFGVIRTAAASKPLVEGGPVGAARLRPSPCAPRELLCQPPAQVPASRCCRAARFCRRAARRRRNRERLIPLPGSATIYLFKESGFVEPW